VACSKASDRQLSTKTMAANQSVGCSVAWLWQASLRSNWWRSNCIVDFLIFFSFLLSLGALRVCFVFVLSLMEPVS